MPVCQQREQISFHQVFAARNVDQNAVRLQFTQRADIENTFRRRRQGQHAHQHACCAEKCIELLCPGIGGDARQIFRRPRPSLHWEFKSRNRFGHARADGSQAHHTDGPIRAVECGQCFPFLIALLRLVSGEFAGLAEKRMANVFRHLHRHTGVVQSDDGDIFQQTLDIRNPQYAIRTRTNIEYRFQAPLVCEQFRWRRPDNRIVGLPIGEIKRPSPDFGGG